MPYVARPSTAMRKNYKKRPYARKTSTRSMYTIAKRVLKSNTETKSRITAYSTGGMILSHNVPRLVAAQCLQTSQGTDGDGTSGNRIGIAVEPVGLKLYMELAQEQPLSGTNMVNGNIFVKVWILKAHHSSINTSNDFLRLISSNTMLAPV